MHMQAMIDRESADARNGAFILEITAMEVAKTGGTGLSISTEVTVIIEVGKLYTLKTWSVKNFPYSRLML